MEIRELRQSQAVDAFLNSNKKSILGCCPRFGKIRCSIKILEELKPEKILIAFPRHDIAEGWRSDFKKWKYKNDNITFTTFRSLKNHVKESWDFLIIDEIQEASSKQLEMLWSLVQKTPSLGLSGTITGKTEKQIQKHTGMEICYKYSIEQAVQEGILTDYDIYIHLVDLDTGTKIYSKNTKTEKRYFDAISYRKEQMDSPSQKWFMELKQIKILQNSLAKLNKTKKLINEYEDQRLLIFTGLIEIANQLEVPTYHSKSRDRQVFIDFCNGVNYKHLATVNMMQAGITILPIDKGLVNYISGAPENTAQKICRFLGFEYATPNKKASIHLVSSREKFELNRIKTALSFFEDSKIHYIES